MEKRWQILFITSLGVFIASLDLFIVNIAFPAIAADFSGASLSQLSWILNAYAIVLAALLVPAGRIADRIGRKRIFLLGLAAFVRRSSTHPAPVIELALLRIRPVAIGNAAAMVFFAGFAAMLLGAVLFLTEVWGYSIVRAGLAIAPGPLVAAITAAPAGRIAARYGPRLPAVVGGLTFAAGFA
jgi:MFS family permease